MVFPSSDDPDQHLITIIGKKESVDSAKAELENLIKDLVSCAFNTLPASDTFN